MLRRLLVLGTLLAMLAMPTSAQALAPQYIPDRYIPAEVATAPLDYKGWTYLNLNYCPPDLACTMQYRDSMRAWRWTGTAWVSDTIRQGWVYVWPYSGSWRWAWHADSGRWVAVSGGRFELRTW